MASHEHAGDLLGAEEVQRLLAISPATYYRWLKDGRLRGVKVGRRWRFDPRAVDAILRPQAGADSRHDLEEAARIGSMRLRDLGWTERRIEEVRDMNATERSDLAAGAVRLLIEHAVAREASDLSIDPVADGLVVRERIGGILETLDPPLPEGSRSSVVGALKSLGGLEDTTRPQSGHFFYALDDRKVDVRVSTYPTADGESVSLRLLAPEAVVGRVEDLDFAPEIAAPLREILRTKRSGIIVVNGLAGSGKRTTLYSILREFQRPELKIMTAEDPIGVRLEGALQATVSASFTCGDAIRAMLDNDLDIGMVSDLRDKDAAVALVHAAQTGHLMLAGLHARDAVTALTMLLEMVGPDRAGLVESLNCILAQRLVRRSCAECKTMRTLSPEEADFVGLTGSSRRLKVASNAGCEACGGTGQRQRVVVAELLTMSPDLASAAMKRDAGIDDLRSALGPAFRSIRDDLLSKLGKGEVSFEAAAHVL